jgi:protein phosphatase
MGTTSTVAALMDNRLFVAQVGDSRAYVLRGQRLVQVSRDQSLVNQLIEAGQLTEEEAETFEHNNIILQALGTAETVQVDLTYVDLQVGDRLLLCSDGLSGMVRADEMREVLLGFKEPFEACRELVDRANRAGGHDNITVIVADFDGPGVAPHDPAAELAYKKYPLPEAPAHDATARAAPVPLQVSAAAPTSEEAQRESRRLRVGHTMIGVQFQLPPEQATPVAPMARPQSNPPMHFDPAEDPVQIPTDGLAPSVVGALVLAAMIFVAVVGFLFLH